MGVPLHMSTNAIQKAHNINDMCGLGSAVERIVFGLKASFLEILIST